MKRILIALVVLCILLCGCAKNSTDDAVTQIADGEYYEYSSDGSLKTAKVTYKDGKEVRRERYSYDLGAKLSKVEVIEGGEVIATNSFMYEDGKLCQQADEYTEDGKKIKVLSYFDADGRPTKYDYYVDGEFSRGEVYSYNEKGHLLRTDNVDKNGDVISYYEYECDDEGKILKVYYYEFGELAGVFDGEGKPIGDVTEAETQHPDIEADEKTPSPLG